MERRTIHLKMIRVVALLAVLWGCDARTFGQICDGNTNNRIRSWDTWGSGHYGASRVYGSHEGVDVECEDGSDVYAPFDGTLAGKLIVYNDPEKAAIDSGINLRGKGLCVKMFYVSPDKTSGTVTKGEKIGTMMSMQSVYPGITSHVHIQLCDKSDITPYF